MAHLACGTEGQCQEQSCINQFCFACGVPIEHPVGIEEAHSNNFDPSDGQESITSSNGHLEDRPSEDQATFDEGCEDHLQPEDIPPLPDEYYVDPRAQPGHNSPSSDHYNDHDQLAFGPHEEDCCNDNAAGPSFNEYDDMRDV